MQSLIIIKNSSSHPVISAILNDELLFYDIIKNETSPAKPCLCGSNSVRIITAGGKTIHDLWLSFMPCTVHILEIYDSHTVFKTIPPA